MLTVLQEGVLMDIFAEYTETTLSGPWVKKFLQDNHDRHALDPRAYFISPKMWSILNGIKGYGESL